MQYVTTLISATVKEFPVELAAEAAASVADVAQPAGAPRWLGPAACDVVFETEDLPAAEQAIRGVIGDRPLDLLTQPLAHRRKRLLVADMESTMIREEMLDELAELKGIRAEISAVTARAMNGELDFAEALKARVALLEGLPIASLYDTWRHVTLMPGARLLVETMRRNGARTVLVSGGFTIFTSQLREMLGFDADHGNELEFRRGVLTGGLVPPIRDRDSKLRVLHSETETLGLAMVDSLAVGDGANDLSMLLEAGVGIAYHAKPAVREAARFRIDHADLTALLYIQGYRREDFAS